MILDPSQRGRLLPLPVVLISTVDRSGVRNIAPYGNVMPILRPLDLIAFASWFRRDTLENIRATEEFVINIPSIDLVDAVMICSKNYPKDVDEFEEAKLTVRESEKVKAPSIAECIGWMECVLEKEVVEEGKYAIIIGKVVYLEVDDQYLTADGAIDLEKARPLSMMLGKDGMQYTYPRQIGEERRYAEMSIR
ncbi:MAG: flavin reductase family protein [Candidatus Syntrophoarchaeum sp.]|nr:flavin reductase family protein [Candidatus Syntrophoarchaeum sp.]